MISRRQARRQALILVYQWDISRGRDRLAATAARSIRGRASSPRRRSLTPPTSTAGSRRPSDGWAADRLGVVERTALRVAIEELDRGEVPQEVVIDEAVGYTKRYASDEGARLVNGILGTDPEGGGCMSF